MYIMVRLKQLAFIVLNEVTNLCLLDDTASLIEEGSKIRQPYRRR